MGEPAAANLVLRRDSSSIALLSPAGTSLRFVRVRDCTSVLSTAQSQAAVSPSVAPPLPPLSFRPAVRLARRDRATIHPLAHPSSLLSVRQRRRATGSPLLSSQPPPPSSLPATTDAAPLVKRTSSSIR
jgi:hypothetical protein